MSAVLAVVLVPLMALAPPAPAGGAPQRTFTFSVATRGVVASDVEAFAAEAAAALNDARSWSLGGAVRFERVPSGGDFTLWLAEPSTLTSYSSICSPTYSCSVGRDVVINDLRWRTSTDAFRGGGGSLTDYRRYVVNHEVGHWLGFGHTGCPAAGAASPVMAQQSKTLAGCRPSAWPSDAERAALAARLGVVVAPSGVPVGSLELVAASGPERVRVAGWAADPDAGTAPISVHVYVAGQGFNLGPVTGSRTDVAAAHPWAGAAHGFDRTLGRIPPGVHQLCAFAIGVGSGGNALLGCRAVAVVDDLQGNLELARWAVAPGAVRVGGWALDLDASTPTDVHVYLAGTGHNLGPAQLARPDLVRFGVGDRHGFDRVLRGVPPGTHRACAFVIDTGAGPPSLAACRTVTVPGTPFGHLDVAEAGAAGLRVAGWAVDPETAAPINVHVYATYADGTTRGANLGPADTDRADIGRALPAYGGAHGFVATPAALPAQVGDIPAVRVCAYAIGVGVGGSAVLGCRAPTS